MQTNITRIKEIIDTMADFNDSPGQGVTRFSYGEQDKRARGYLAKLCREIGLEVTTDAVGNMFARLEGKDPSLPVIMTGSHIDSVKCGGRFDGIAGCACALEAARVMVENNHKPLRPLVIAFFAEEEGSNFMPLFGSKAMVGKFDVSDLKSIRTRDNTAAAYDMVKNAGFPVDRLAENVWKKGQIKAMLELHIEQSVRLEAEGHTIGIVSGIAGITWLEVEFEGQSNHAGATPMHLRRDALAAASKVICRIEDMAKRAGQTTVATVGRVDVLPNVPNAIPRHVKFIVDIRDVVQSGIDQVNAEVEKAAAQAAGENNVKYSIKKITTVPPISIPPYLTELLEQNAQKLKLDYIFMPSGALHDCCNVSELGDVGIIFIPSIDGRSHVPEEETRYEDIKAGSDLLLASLLQLTELD